VRGSQVCGGQTRVLPSNASDATNRCSNSIPARGGPISVGTSSNLRDNSANGQGARTEPGRHLVSQAPTAVGTGGVSAVLGADLGVTEPVSPEDTRTRREKRPYAFGSPPASILDRSNVERADLTPLLVRGR
jgi:hypothetical protein